jgi:hypothetical protein
MWVILFQIREMIFTKIKTIQSKQFNQNNSIKTIQSNC